MISSFIVFDRIEFKRTISSTLRNMLHLIACPSGFVVAVQSVCRQSIT